MKTSIKIPLTLENRTIISEDEKKEQQYQYELADFLRLNNFDSENLVFDEDYYINDRISLFENLVIDYKKTADFDAGRELDGKELINDVLTNTKMGTVGDLEFAIKELAFLQKKKESLKNPIFTEDENKLSINQIALKLVYENESVTKENANEIIKEYGHTSGHKLYLRFNFYYKRINRIGDNNDTKKVLENRIKLLEDVIKLLEDNFKEKAIDECETLKTYLVKY